MKFAHMLLPAPVERGTGRIRTARRLCRSVGAAACAVGLSLTSGCGDGEVSGTAPPPKAVETINLRLGVPRAETRVAGVVEPYRQSDVSFDVAGILDRVIDLGEVADGPQFDGAGELLLAADGRPVREGDVLAALDTTRFEQAVTAAELSLASTDRQIEAIQVELDAVFPARVANAEANASSASAEVVSARESVSASEAELDLAQTTVDRDRVLIQSGAIAQSVLDESESSFRTATASLAQARSALDGALQSEQSAIASVSETRGDFRVREADLASLQASRAELVNALEQAQTDLDACTLRAPFRGRVTERYSERGSYINAGSSIVQLTMETAVKVVLTLSPEQEREISLGTQLPVYVDVESDGSSPVAYPATVFEKASVADSGTRTFRVGLILPNVVLNGFDTQDEGSATSMGDLFPVLTLPEVGTTELFVNTDCVFMTDEQAFVLALPRADAASTRLSDVQIPSRVPITLTDQWQQFDTATLRGIEPTDALSPGDPLVLHPTPDTERGVRVGSLQYAFRSGDVVRVGLGADLPESGFWVPAAAIVSRSGQELAYTIVSGAAREIVVDVVETSGGFRRVASPELSEGAPIVVRGMQYLADSDAVTSESAADAGVR